MGIIEAKKQKQMQIENFIYSMLLNKNTDEPLNLKTMCSGFADSCPNGVVALKAITQIFKKNAVVYKL